MLRITKLILFLSCILISTSYQARAALGERADSLGRDQKSLFAKRMNGNVFSKFSVQELQTDATHIKEYVDADGIIFALTWSGLDHPDLAILLGSYFADYHLKESVQRKPHGVRHQRIEASSLVVQKWGHMRRLEGRAYDPKLIPAGVSLDEIQ